eukprot:968136_1
MSGYGSTEAKHDRQQSLLSAPPQSKKAVQTPKVIEQSSVPIVNKIHHCSKIIIYIFIAFGLASVVITVLEIVQFNITLLFVVLLGGTIILSLGGAFGIYKWGTVQMQIDRF